MGVKYIIKRAEKCVDQQNKLVWAHNLNYTEPHYDSVRVRIQDISSSYFGMLDELKMLHNKQLNGCKLPNELNMDCNFVDNRMSHKHDASFLQDPVLQRNEELLFWHLLSSEGYHGHTAGLWNKNKIASWQMMADKFMDYLMAAIHIAGGQPARVPELTSILYWNSNGSIRGIYINGGLFSVAFILALVHSNNLEEFSKHGEHEIDDEDADNGSQNSRSGIHTSAALNPGGTIANAIDMQAGHMPWTADQNYALSNKSMILIPANQMTTTYPEPLRMPSNASATDMQAPVVSQSVNYVINLSYNMTSSTETMATAEATAAGPITHKTDLVAIMPTGAGKSLIYQLPVLVEATADKTTIVVSPLAVLCFDIVNECMDLGIKVHHWTRSSDSGVDLLQGITSFGVIIVAVENLDAPKFKDLAKELSHQGKLSQIVLDEAHLIVSWASFHSAMDQILSLCRYVVPFVFLLAMIPLSMVADIMKACSLISVADSLNMPAIIRMSTVWQNIAYRVATAPSADTAQQQLLTEYRHLHNDPEYQCMTILIFCITRGCCIDLTSCIDGAQTYHSSLSTDERLEVYNWLKAGGGVNGKTVVATKALGAGINLPEAQVALHLGSSFSLLKYMQESGHIGHTGRPAIVHVFTYNSFSEEVHNLIDFSGSDGHQSNSQVQQQEKAELEHMCDWLANPNGNCWQHMLHKYIDGFSSDCNLIPGSAPVAFCSNCSQPTTNSAVDYNKFMCSLSLDSHTVMMVLAFIINNRVESL
ncbi:hypothetical protein H4R24_005655 [Coemansia sp. RSA 988]|nr:hypothetical protein H4R24_005655 [Coemansia sp. RSA 988]